jgi:hypothetical protein
MTIADRIFHAAVATAEKVTLPDNGLEMPGCMKEWASLIRRHDPNLDTLSDEEIITCIVQDYL